MPGPDCLGRIAWAGPKYPPPYIPRPRPVLTIRCQFAARALHPRHEYT
ncbi:hypothetical protein ASZ90_000768 [hydrocarbon metagenome]|uniref:Uncharacterized protein n=1 Tax=hydrocarbon metagenome TaxID=938273 RepID=A0A0W8G8H6_9ZZZZ